MNTATKHPHFLINTCTTAAMLTCMLATGNAFAGPSRQQTVSEVISLQDINVSSSAGAATVYSRIHAAAIRVCTSAPRDLSQLGEEGRCAKAVEANALQQLNIDALNAYFNKTAGRPIPTVAANSAK